MKVTCIAPLTLVVIVGLVPVPLELSSALKALAVLGLTSYTGVDVSVKQTAITDHLPLAPDVK